MREHFLIFHLMARWPVYLALLAVAIALVVFLAVCKGNHKPALTVDNGAEALQLAGDYAPVLRFVGQDGQCDTNVDTDPYLPSGVDRLLGQRYVNLMWSNFAAPDSVTKNAPGLADIVGKGDGYFVDVLDDGHPWNLDDMCTYEATYLRSGSRPSIYARVVELQARTIVQYWFFYYFDNWVGNRHEGDWEMIQLIFPAESAKAAIDGRIEPDHVDYSEHTGGRQVRWEDVERDPAMNHSPVVYIGAGSHANYSSPGYWEAIVPLFQKAFIKVKFYGCDQTRGRKILAPPSSPGQDASYDLSAVLSDGKNPSGHDAWLRFQGAWGELSTWAFSGLPSIEHQAQGRDPLGWDEKLDKGAPKRCVEQKEGQVTAFGHKVNFTKADGRVETVRVGARKAALFLTTWMGSDISLTLVSPSGRTINGNTEDAGVSHEKGPNYEVYQVVDAEPGDWKMVIEPIDLPAPETVTWELVQVPPTCDYAKDHPHDDSDLDGIPNDQEAARGFDPCSWDTDHDRVADGQDGVDVCAPLHAPVLVEFPDAETAQLSWQPNGACGPLSGTVAARFTDQDAPFATAPIAQGVTDLPIPIPTRCDSNIPEATFSVVFTVSLIGKDGQPASASSVETVQSVCPVITPEATATPEVIQ